MTYAVRYKKVDAWFWSKLKNVKGDGFVDGRQNMRFFILDDETRVEVCSDNMIFKFDQGRFFAIKKEMEQQAGQPISVKSKAV